MEKGPSSSSGWTCPHWHWSGISFPKDDVNGLNQMISLLICLHNSTIDRNYYFLWNNQTGSPRNDISQFYVICWKYLCQNLRCIHALKYCIIWMVEWATLSIPWRIPFFLSWTMQRLVILEVSGGKRKDLGEWDIMVQKGKNWVKKGGKVFILFIWAYRKWI